MNDKNLSRELAHCLEWMEKTGGNPEKAASRFPGHYRELLTLLQTVEQLDGADQPAPSPAFTSVARTRLLNRINAEKSAAQRDVTNAVTGRHIWQINKMGSRKASQIQPQRRFAMNWILIIGMIASVLAGGGGVAYASTDALPGDTLYPVKTMLQDMEMAFAGDEKDAEMLMTQLFTNIQEMERLADQGRFDDILIGLEEYQGNLYALNQVRNQLGYEDSGSDSSLNIRLQQQLQDCTLLLEQLQTRLRTQDQLHIQDQLQQAIQLTDTGNTYGPNEDPGQPEEPGSGTPNGVGPAEPQGTQTQVGKPEDTGTDNGCQANGSDSDCGTGPVQEQTGPPEDSGSGTGTGTGTGTGQDDDSGSGSGTGGPGSGPGGKP